jgi:hypothetical protein
MEINGELKGDLTKLTLAKNQSRDTQTANVDFVTRVDQPTSAEVFGHEFTAAVAFGGMVRRATTDKDGKPDGGETFVHLTKAPQPTGKLVVQMHKARVLGRDLDKIQPALSCRGVQGEAKVDVTIRIPVDLGVDDEFDLKLIKAFRENKVIAVDFEPKQGVLDFEGAG